MAVTHTYTQTVTQAVGSTQTYTQAFTGDAEVNYSNAAFPIGTNALVPLSTIPKNAATGLLAISFSSSTAATVKVNSSGSPDVTITLAAGVPYIWTSTCGFASPFTNPITSLYVTNAALTDLEIASVFTI